MRHFAPVATLAVLAALAFAELAPAQDAVPTGAEEVKRRWHARLDGRHFTASVRLEMNLAGLAETRRLRVWRDDHNETDERLLVRFEAPHDLRNVGLLYLERVDRSNDYFLYQPTTRRVRRLPESLVDDDVYGIDLEFLGFGVAQSEPTEVLAVTRATLGGRSTFRLEERALEANPRFERRTTWLDADTFVAVRTEHQRDGRTVLEAEALDIEDKSGVKTPMRMRFRRLDSDRRVDLYVEDVDFETPIPDEFFSIMALVRRERAH